MVPNGGIPVLPHPPLQPSRGYPPPLNGCPDRSGCSRTGASYFTRSASRLVPPSVVVHTSSDPDAPVSSICPHSHHKSPATLAQSSDRITHHLMTTSDRGRTLKERIGHRLETQVT